jgi:GTPase SAR1 family protein
MAKKFLPHSVCVILVYDVTSKRSFEQVREKWLRMSKEQAPSNAIHVLIGNKCDSPMEKRQISVEVGENFAQRNGLIFLETSATQAINVDHMHKLIRRSIAETFILKKTY